MLSFSIISAASITEEFTSLRNGREKEEEHWDKFHMYGFPTRKEGSHTLEIHSGFDHLVQVLRGDQRVILIPQ